MRVCRSATPRCEKLILTIFKNWRRIRLEDKHPVYVWTLWCLSFFVHVPKTIVFPVIAHHIERIVSHYFDYGGAKFFVGKARLVIVYDNPREPFFPNAAFQVVVDGTVWGAPRMRGDDPEAPTQA